jgi:tetratricopeptide (TPR) repeat protein
MADGDPGGGWDFFISYTQADRRWAEWIAWVLEEHGRYSVLVQAWDFVPGSNWIQDMHAGSRGAARTIAVLSDDYLASKYGNAEWQVAWAADPDGAARKLLTVRVADCARPGLLAGVTGTDLFDLDEAAARVRLLDTVKAAISRRVKPATPPRFPSGGRAVAAEPTFPGAQPRIWGKVPLRNPHFTGRGADLSMLARGLAAEARAMVHSVHGMGGVGKTQLVAEYAHARAREYDVVWWIAAEEPATIPGQFIALATHLGLDPAAKPDVLQAQVHHQLRTVAGWLLVFDNADTVADIRPWLPPGPQPPCVRGHVVVTTRRSGFTAFGRVMELDVIGLADAVALLRSRVPGLGQQIAEQIANELGRLPLALEQAAAYLDISQMPGPDYLELLRTRTGEMHQRGTVAARPEITIRTLWDLSLRRITAQYPAAVQLLDVCAYLAPELIPLDLFTTSPHLLPEPLSATAADPLAFADALAMLADYSLAKRTPAGLQLHRLTQATTRTRHLSTGGAAPLAWPMPELADHPLAVTLALLRASAPDEDIRTTHAAWPRWAALLPHVLAAIGHLTHTAIQLGLAVLQDVVWLINPTGTYMRVYLRAADTKPLFESVLNVAEAAYGPYHHAVAAALNNLAAALRDLGQPGRARPLQERALAIDETAYGPDHLIVARDLNDLAAILWDLGQPGQARPLLERALAIDETAYGPDHPNVAPDLNNLALILQDLGQPGQARSLQERALAIGEAAYGPDHLVVARDLNNLAMILLDLGQSKAARPLQERALAIDVAAYGPDHPDVVAALNNLAVTLRDLGQSGQARSLQERALAIAEAAYGPDHPTVASALNNLATILRDLGQLEQARSLQERALAIAEAAYGPDHPTVARNLNNLALILRDLGQSKAARPLQERALVIDEAAHGPDHPDVARNLNNLAAILQDLGQLEQARPLLERALAIDEAAYGPDHPTVARALNNLAAALRDLGQPEQARPLQERSLAIDEAAHGPDHPDVARNLNNLAVILRDLGQSKAARPLQERALAITQATRSSLLGQPDEKKDT